MSMQNNTPIQPPISSEGCRTVHKIFAKYDNIDAQTLKKIIRLVRAGRDENEIMNEVNIKKN
jgi:hypothetical protein